MKLVRRGRQHDPRQRIAENESQRQPPDQCASFDREDRRRGRLLRGERDHRHLAEAGRRERLLGQRQIVGRAALTEGLGQKNRCLPGVVFSGPEGLDDVADHDDGGVAHIVVHIPEPYVHG